MLFSKSNISNIYETELYTLLNSIKTELFENINIISYSKDEIINNIYSIILEFNAVTVHRDIISYSFENSNTISNNLYSGLFSSIILGVKSSLMIFVFI